MTHRQQWLLVGTIVAMLAAGLFTASRFLHDGAETVAVGSAAPAFSAITTDSVPQLRTFDAYKGNVVLLNIWGTFCVPCRTEMPSIEAMYRQMHQKGVRVVAVSIDPPGKMQDIRDFVKEFKLSFDVLYDTSGTIQETYRITGVPQSFIIARDGTIRRMWLGQDDWNSEGNRKLIESLLAESPQ